MEIKSLFKTKPKAPPPEYFLAVEVHDSLLKTALWQVEDEKASVISIGTFEAWEDIDSLVNGLDASLTQAVKGLGEEPDRVIFGLPESWLDGDKLDPERAHLIKKIIKELNLKPIGLVTITEAILQQLKADEGIPATAILLEVYQTKVTVSLVRLGQVEKQEEVGRSDDLAKDVEEGLTRMDSERLPVRFILTNGSDLENEEQQIISYPWLDKLNFFHLPKVETLPADYSIRAIALSGGAEAAKSLGLEMDTPQEKESEVSAIVDDSLESFGFSVEKAELSPAEEISEKPEAKAVGYVTNDFSDETTSDLTAEIDEESNLVDPHLPKQNRKKLSLPSINFRHLKPALPKFSAPPLLSKLKLIIPLLLLIIIPLAAYLVYTFTAKADITIKIKPKSITQEVPVLLANSPQTDKATVPTVFQNIDISVTNSLQTTGESVVGDKAVGQITIYNRSAQEHIFKAGTKITSATGQVFSLDSNAAVASSSADPNPPFIVTPGSAGVSVTAAKIGVESNLSKGTQFSVDNYPKSVFVAISDSGFTKGSSRTVKAVGKDDVSKLLDLTNGQIQTEISKKVANSDPDQRSLAVSDYQVIKKNFSNAVGEEASSLSLDLSVKVPILSYSYTHLVDIISEDVVAKSQPGMRLLPEKTNIDLQKPVKTSDTIFTSSAKLNGVIVPTINTENYKNLILGKSVSEAARLLQTVVGSSGVTIKVTPVIPLLSRQLPSNKSRISITLQVE